MYYTKTPHKNQVTYLRCNKWYDKKLNRECRQYGRHMEDDDTGKKKRMQSKNRQPLKKIGGKKEPEQRGVENQTQRTSTTSDKLQLFSPAVDNRPTTLVPLRTRGFENEKSQRMMQAFVFGDHDDANKTSLKKIMVGISLILTSY